MKHKLKSGDGLMYEWQDSEPSQSADGTLDYARHHEFFQVYKVTPQGVYLVEVDFHGKPLVQSRYGSTFDPKTNTVSLFYRKILKVEPDHVTVKGGDFNCGKRLKIYSMRSCSC